MKKKHLLLIPLLLLAHGMRSAAQNAPMLENDSLTFARLGDLDLSLAENGYGEIKKDLTIDGNPLRIEGTEYAHGVGAHATFRMVINLNNAIRFHAVLGLDDETEGGQVDYRIVLREHDGKEHVTQQGGLNSTDSKSAVIDVATGGYRYMILEVEAGATNAYDHIDWADAYFVFNRIITTEPFAVNPKELASPLDCATQVFAIPGVPFMQKVRATNRKAQVAASGLPDGLSWNARRQLVEGTIAEAGTYHYNLTVIADGQATEHQVTLTCSDSLEQPRPFMGLLTWNVFEENISSTNVIAIAEALLEYGLADAGYTYLCIDDKWALHDRDENGRLQYDPDKFPGGLNKLADYVHRRGLKFGIYSDAGTYTCSGAQPGSWLFEDQDAESFVGWDFDLLKYDFCNSPGSSEAVAKDAYTRMGDALKKHRKGNFIYYICEWGWRSPWLWGTEAGGSCWRVTDDTRDCWENPTLRGGVLDNIRVYKNIWQYNGVNRWNDADMMMCGIHGTGKSSSDGTNGKGMTQDEYRTQFALWCMWSSPLTLSFDITNLGGKPGITGTENPYYREDLEMITNPRLIALDQDCLGQCAQPIYDTDSYLVFQKDLEGGDVAISVTNLDGENAQDVKIRLADFDALLPGKTYEMQNCWTGGAAGSVSNTDVLSFHLPAHATAVYRLTKK